MGQLYTITRTNTALVVGNDFFTINAGANKSFRLREITVAGNAIASAANVIGIYRVGTLGVTGSSPITPAPLNLSEAAFSGVVNTVWGTQPVIAALILPISVNGNGGVFRWVPPPGQEIEVSGFGSALAAANQLSIGRSIAGTSLVSINVTIEEF
jgi:hypothetical protein